MARVKELEFSIRWFSDALRDFEPINPFIVGCMIVLKLNPYKHIYSYG